MKIKYIFCFLFLFASQALQAEECEGLSKKACKVVKTFDLADKTKNLHFNHLCSELDYSNHNSYRAYALFSSEDGKALALGEVLIGLINQLDALDCRTSKHKPLDSQNWCVHNPPLGVGFTLHTLKAIGLEKWAGQQVSLSLQMENQTSKEKIRGPLVNSYSSVDLILVNKKPPKTSAENKEDFPNIQTITEKKRFFQISKEGYWDWSIEQIPPQSELKNHYIKFTSNFSKDMYIPKETLIQPDQTHKLYLVIKNKQTEEELILQGPMLNNFEALLQKDQYYKGPYNNLNLINALNPFQQGGLVDWLEDDWSYRNCKYVEQKAKKEFFKKIVKNM